MIRMFFSHIFYTKVIYYQGEGYWSGRMSPQTWRVDTFVIPMRRQSFSEEFISQNAALWESPHSSPYFQEHKAILCVSVQIVLNFGPFWE